MEASQGDLQMMETEVQVQDLQTMDVEMVDRPEATSTISPTNSSIHPNINANTPSAGIQAGIQTSSVPAAIISSNDSDDLSASLDESSSSSSSEDSPCARASPDKDSSGEDDSSDEDSSSDDDSSDDSSSDEDSNQSIRGPVVSATPDFYHGMESPLKEKKSKIQGFVGRLPLLYWNSKLHKYLTKKQYVATLTKKHFKAYKLGELHPLPMTVDEHNAHRRELADVKKTRKVIAEERAAHQGIKRNPKMWTSLQGMVLNRELGYVDHSAPAVCFAQALEYMGSTQVVPNLSRTNQVSSIFVTNNHAGGAAVAYAGGNYGPLSSNYLKPRGSFGSIAYNSLQPLAGRKKLTAAYEGAITSINYNSHHNKMILTRRGVDKGLSTFSPVLEYPGEGDSTTPFWNLAEITPGTYHHYQVPAHPKLGERFVTDSACGGANSEYVACISTNCGLLLLQSDDRLICCRPDDVDRRPLWCTDFKQGANNILYAGANNGLLWLVDTRTRWEEGMWINHFGPARRVISVSQHEVLAAGEESMALYDVRALRSGAAKPKLVDRPIVYFPDHENNTETPGVAVDFEHGLVAASQTSLPFENDAYVAVFSLYSGARLSTPGLSSKTHGCSNAMVFEKLWDEDFPSLLVGHGRNLYKYSVPENVDNDDDDEF